MRVLRPHGDELDDWNAPLFMPGSVTGGVSTIVELDLMEKQAWQAEQAEREARRRPAGFAPWPEDAPVDAPLRRVA